MGRIDNAAQNIKYGYIGMILTLILKFISRTVFINTIGVEYLGVNGLYSNILSVLSFAELGIGTAMNYSLYKPVAENNKEKIKSLMYLYKHAYRWIAFTIAVIGLALAPFLKFIVKDSGDISQNQLIIYYLIFLFNTVSTYFVSYKYSLVNAMQKNYIQTSIITLTNIAITVFQVFVLIIYRNYFYYLIIAAVIELLQKMFVYKYFKDKYPYLSEGYIQKLPQEEITTLKKNIKALVFHKIGDISALQTDNILISSLINISTVGYISNYMLIITSVTSFIDIIFNALTPSFGNLIATESIDRQYKLFKIYRFAGFWLYGFATIAFIVLLDPFVELWIGSSMIISREVIYLIMIDYYFKGHRIIVNNFKVAAGVFNEDKYLAFIRGIVNLIISLIMVKKIGLPGIYIGTLLSGLIPSILRSKIIYNKIFRISVNQYFKDSVIYLMILLIPLAILELIKKYMISSITTLSFIGMVVLVSLIPNIIFIILLRNREEFKYLFNLVNLKSRKKYS